MTKHEIYCALKNLEDAELRVTAKNLQVEEYQSKSPEDLINHILQTVEDKKIVVELKLHWWARNKHEVYAVVGLILAVVAIWLEFEFSYLNCVFNTTDDSQEIYVPGTMSPPPRIHGQVTEMGSDLPIANVRVWYSQTISTYSDNDGVYVLTFPHEKDQENINLRAHKLGWSLPYPIYCTVAAGANCDVKLERAE